ncbi:MAG: hypothetical protein NT035_12300 [Burkholderiales bacterium]|nr:hypothetical protein [Burkholderiales bacterium]
MSQNVSDTHTSPEEDVPAKPSNGLPTATDIMFLVMLLCILLGVGWVGQLSYQEGMKNEVTKQNGEAWSKWFKENSAARFKEGFPIEACIGSATERKRWGECFAALQTGDTPMKDLRNPFTGELPQFVAKCDTKDHSSIGGIFLEKLSPTPAGSAIPMVATQLVDNDPIDSLVSMRITVCDRGGYAIKIEEFEF